MAAITQFWHRLSVRIWVAQVAINLPLLTVLYLATGAAVNHYTQAEFQNTLRTKTRLVAQVIAAQPDAVAITQALDDLMLGGEIRYAAYEVQGEQPVVLQGDLPADFTFRENLRYGEYGNHLYGISVPVSAAQPAVLRLVYDEQIVAEQTALVYKWGFYSAITYAGIYLPLALVGAVLLTAPLRRLGKAARRIATGERETPIHPGTSIREMRELAVDMNHMRVELLGHARELELRETRQRSILENAAEGILALDARGLITGFNHAAEEMLGYSCADVQGTPFSRLLTAGAAQKLMDPEGRPVVVTARTTQAVRANGETCHVLISISAFQDAGDTLYTVVILDISERVALEQQLTQLAYYDPLTGLPNRRLFMDRLDHAMKTAKRHECVVGLLFLDLDHFKKINDTLGHLLGDLLLKQVADRLASVVRQEDTVARLGGDEFTIVLGNIRHVDAVEAVAQKICALFQEPVRVGDQLLHVSTSIGITVYPLDDSDIEELIKNADTAMYEAKASGRNTYAFYTQRQRAALTEWVELDAALRRALHDPDQLQLHFQPQVRVHYQPQIDRQTGEIIAAEALIRWQHPTLGWLYPNKFIPVAEESGLIVELGEWVLETVCRQIRAWRDAEIPPLRLSVNVSARQLKAGFPERVAAMLQEYAIDPGELELEITETMILADSPLITEVLAALKAIGVRLAVDDFGTGHSPLSHIQRLPIDTIKIDRSFIHNVHKIGSNAAIAEAVIDMAHSLGLNIVAEGVEIEEEMIFLCNRGCDVLQGFYFERAMSAEKLETLLRRDINFHAVLDSWTESRA